MLDFRKLISQIKEVGRTSSSDKEIGEEIVLRALDAYDRAEEKGDEFIKRLADNQLTVLWPLAQPLEVMSDPQNQFGYAVNLDTPNHTVVAADGSQIMPSHHEVHNCYLINIGSVVLSYGVEEKAVLESVPRLYHKAEDLYPLINRRRMHIDELQISLQRFLLELETICNHLEMCTKRKLPAIALIDGSLIPWSLEKMPPAYQQEFHLRLLALYEILAEKQVPLVGYISQSRATDVVNALRTFECPYERNLCAEFCGHLNEEDFPCSKIWPLTDRQLYSKRLNSNCRSPVFVSGNNFVRSMPKPEQTCFTYLNVGSETARLEFPYRVFQDKQVFQFVLSAVCQQVEKGFGYPLSLAEAHYLAVIRGADRSRFFDLLGEHLISLGKPRVAVSPKELRKRRGII
jgi:hypothetical protein